MRLVRLNVTAAFTAAVLLSACRPYVSSYEHVCFEEISGLVVLERSTSSTDSQGHELKLAKTGMPLKVSLRRPNYSVESDTPLNIAPVLFLRATTSEGAALSVKGAHLYPLAEGSAAALAGYRYWFNVDEARGAPLEMVASDSSGKVVGTERLRYSLRSRGFSFGVDAV